VNDEFERIWKEAGVAYCARIYLPGRYQRMEFVSKRRRNSAESVSVRGLPQFLGVPTPRRILPPTPFPRPPPTQNLTLTAPSCGQFCSFFRVYIFLCFSFVRLSCLKAEMGPVRLRPCRAPPHPCCCWLHVPLCPCVRSKHSSRRNYGAKARLHSFLKYGASCHKSVEGRWEGTAAAAFV
jgi:hypothetical protein